MIEIFPVVPGSGPREYSARGKRCRASGLWYADTHDAPRRGGRLTHEAQDIFARTGSLVLAPEAGEVIASGTTPRGGHWLRLFAPDDDGRGRTYYFAHLDAPAIVQRGELVRAGQLVGYVGRTGNARRTCPHLHLRAAKGRDRWSPGRERWVRGPAINLFAELRAVDPTRAGKPAPPPATPSPPEVTPSEPDPCPCQADPETTEET